MRLIDRRIEPSCTYCEHGADIGQGEIACVRRGIVEGEGSCSKFKYEPMKRVPERMRRPAETKLSKEDFEL